MNKQIEEMAMIACGTTRKCEDCFIKTVKKECSFINVAKKIYNEGYRKLNDGDVVITKEQNEKWLKFLESNMQKARKETAREILRDMFEKIKGYENIDIILKQLAKVYGVEVE